MKAGLEYVLEQAQDKWVIGLEDRAVLDGELALLRRKAAALDGVVTTLHIIIKTIGNDAEKRLAHELLNAIESVKEAPDAKD